MSARGDITVGVIGSGWIVRAHVHALHTLNHLGRLPARVRLKWIYGRRPERMAALAAELGVERPTTDWAQIMEDPEVDVVANAGAHPLHAPVSLAAIAAGKHVLCEKPLAVVTDEARQMERAAAGSGLRTACGFSYRFVPAVRLLRDLVAEGRLGTLRHYRGLYLQDWLSNNPDFPGGVGGSAVRDFSHLFDMLRHVVGEPRSVVGTAQPILTGADDTFLAGFEMAGGATASLEASSCATGWKARHRIEVNGTEGSAWWDMEDFNKLHVMFVEDQRQGLGGFRDVLVTEHSHPFMDTWWEAGHVVGWESTFVHQWGTFLRSVIEDRPGDPLQAGFHDGVRANELGDAVLASAREGRRLDLDPGGH
ncbi:MAG TPA: Gfo/Idh/MocA family oxidoreductase [Baekduia sp.]|uniref:Gfo/Idh/MocA family protein n=1 Tax=Baekduia sp. TaxID=2600305 RepID=UPI002D796058|nr:Gfo/Idh/MocA family oxidoreductase [Baekduia sp.]HET6507850.1 Gfo/Idh/MocA family oxidoreductase [Baekduia sp.]